VVKVYENNGWTKIGENSGLVLMIIDTCRDRRLDG
jgi:hypothetical protein